MGYTLMIGEFLAETTLTEYGADTNHTAVRVERGDVPLNSSETRTNEVWPSYSSWAGFADDVGLTDVFYDSEVGLLREHPGAQMLTEKHLVRFRKAQEDYTESTPRNAESEYNFRRLDWLVWWTEWAIRTCERPVFANW